MNDELARTGGAEVYTHRLGNGLAERGHEVKLFGGVNTRDSELGKYVRSWYNTKAKRKISTVLDAFDPDIVHCNNIFGYISASILSEVKSREIPLVMKIEDTRLLYPFFERGVPARSSLWRKLHPFLYLTKIPIYRYLIRMHTDGFLAPSEYVASMLGTKAGFKPMSIVRNPVPWEINERSEPHSNKILFVGSVEDDKGVHVLLRSTAQLVEETSDVTVEIIGGIKRDYSELIDQLEIRNRVTFRGFVEDEEELREAYRKAAVFVLPSTICENSPLTIVEAMSQGTPVITTALGGQQELIRDGENGYVVPPNDPSALAWKVELLVSDNDRWETMSRNASESARQFSIDDHVEAIESLYRGLVD